jgi:hypothetical protein
MDYASPSRRLVPRLEQAGWHQGARLVPLGASATGTAEGDLFKVEAAVTYTVTQADL